MRFHLSLQQHMNLMKLPTTEENKISQKKATWLNGYNTFPKDEQYSHATFSKLELIIIRQVLFLCFILIFSCFFLFFQFNSKAEVYFENNNVEQKPQAKKSCFSEVFIIRHAEKSNSFTTSKVKF